MDYSSKNRDDRVFLLRGFSIQRGLLSLVGGEGLGGYLGFIFWSKGLLLGNIRQSKRWTMNENNKVYGRS
jgi:hypothetical protein